MIFFVRGRGHLLFLLLLTVKGEEPSQEFCLTFCVQPGAMQAVKRCELCRGDMGEPDYDYEDYYDHNQDIPVGQSITFLSLANRCLISVLFKNISYFEITGEQWSGDSVRA